MNTRIATMSNTDSDSFTAGSDAAKQAKDELGVERVDFCQVFCGSNYEYSAVLDGIRGVVGEDTKLIGCSSAGEFTENGVVDNSVTLALVTSDTLKFFTGLGTGLGESVTSAVRDAVQDLPNNVEGHPHLAAINLHDGLAGVGESLALTTQRKLGQKIRFVGGSAGDNMDMEITHVFEGDTVAGDAVGIALIASKEPCTVTLNHGHGPISDLFEVTKADGNIVHELDGRPAFEVWKEQVRDAIEGEYDVSMDELSIGDTILERALNEYELGIDQGERYKIRWPGLTSTTDGPLTFAVNIPEGTEMRVMHSPPDKQIESARNAAMEARELADDSGINIAGGFIYDCVCRAAILGDGFDDAVSAVVDELQVPFVGFETYGELCMQAGEVSGFHNTTSVILLLPE